MNKFYSYSSDRVSKDMNHCDLVRAKARFVLESIFLSSHIGNILAPEFADHYVRNAGVGILYSLSQHVVMQCNEIWEVDTKSIDLDEYFGHHYIVPIFGGTVTNFE